MPGNHDHRLAEPLLDELSIAGEPLLGLEHHQSPTGPAALVDEWLGRARLQIAYPGIWLRDDVYATHGHYMDAHLKLPRAECVAAALMARISPTAARTRRPRSTTNGSSAPSTGSPTASPRCCRSGAAATGPSSGPGRCSPAKSGRRTLGARAARAGFPLAIRGLNGLLHADFEADVTPRAIFRTGVEAATEMAARLGVDDVHVITGHTHRGGPLLDRSRVAPPPRRPPPQHRQLGLRLGLPPAGHAAELLLAGNRHLARRQRPPAPRPAPTATPTRR